jgi:polysaccharide export outer membrane protein
VVLLLTACAPTPSVERAADGSTIYLDELSDAAKADARQKIIQALNRGVAAYGLEVGDEVEIFFHINREPTRQRYLIMAADKLRIEFLGDAENSRTVQVPPDGWISMPLIGTVMAAGQTTDALARQLQDRYSQYLTEPKITVTLTETHSPLDDFIEALGATGKGRSIVARVLPDGTVSLPLLSPLKARGLTLPELKREIDTAYAAKRLAVSVSVIPRSLLVGATMVVGEVIKPGRIELDRPVTVAMVVAQAGGVAITGAANAVRLFYIGLDGQQRVRSINLDTVLDDMKLEDDMIVPPNSIIYVPPSALANAGRFMDAMIRDILRFQGLFIGGGFQFQSGGGGSTTIITNH